MYAVGRLAVSDSMWNGHRIGSARLRRRRRRTVSRHFVRVSYEPASMARHRPDESLLPAGVSDRPSSGAYPARERVVRHEAPTPHHTDELVFADDPVPVLHQMNQEVEDLRLHVGDRALSTELAAVAVDLTVLENKGHSPAPGGIQIFSSRPHALLQDSRRPDAALSRPCPCVRNLRVAT
jgi:hypothetical protein